MSTAETPVEQAPEPPSECPELETAINARYQDLFAGAMALVKRRCAWMKPAARKERAESILQEAVARAWGRRAAFDRTRQPVAWLMGFVHKVALEQLSKQTKQVSQTDLGDTRWNQAMSGLMETKADGDEFELLRLARNRLTLEQQRVLTLAYEESLDGAELAERLGVTPGAARVAKCRALQSLREKYKELDGSGGQ
jgi:RNA polymerase sigma factor (sigma-70 family)